MSLTAYIRQAHHTAVEKGWWEQDCPECNGTGIEVDRTDGSAMEYFKCEGKKVIPLERNVGEQVLLQISELTEMFEEYRNHHGMNEIYYNDKKPEGIPIEFADCLIRIFDFAGKYGIDLEAALNLKMAYNKTRPRRHGGKRA